MSSKTRYGSRQQRKAERTIRKSVPAGTAMNQREMLDDVLAGLDYEHIALGLETEAFLRKKLRKLVLKTEQSAEEDPLAALGLLYDHLYPSLIYGKNCNRFWIR